MRLHVEALGDEVVARHLLAMSGRATNAAPAMIGVIAGLYNIAERQFESQGGYGGTPWPPLADTTVERKAREGLDPRILHATLDLRESLTEPGGANIAVPLRDGVIFGTTIDYAQFLKDRWPMVVPTESDKRSWVKVVQKWIIDGDLSRGGILGGIV
jgi:hypothetical protein